MRLSHTSISVLLSVLAALPSQGVEVNKEELLSKVKVSTMNYELFKERVRRLRTDLEKRTIVMNEEECIRKAINSNPFIGQAEYEIKSQEKALMSARFGWMPKLTVSGTPGFGKYWDSTTETPIQSSVDGTQLYTNQTFSNNNYSYLSSELGWYFLDIPRDKIIQQRVNNLGQYKSLYNLAVRDLVRDIQLVYASLQANILALNKYSEIIAASSKAVAALERQFNVRYVSLADVSNAKTQQLNLMETYLALYGQIEADTARLAGLMGYKDDTLIMSRGKIRNPTQWGMNIGDTIEAARIRNDKYKALILASRAQAAEAQSLITSNLPKLYLSLSGYYQGNRGYYEAELNNPDKEYNNTSTRYFEGYAGIGFSVSIDGGMSILEGQSMELSSQATREEATGAQVSYVELVKKAYNDLEIDRLRVEAAQGAVQEAENVALVMRAVSSLGIADTIQQVQSIELYGDAVIGLTSALLRATTAKINLFRYTSTLPDELKDIKLYVVGLD